MARIQQSLIAAQELGDEKLQVVTQLQEMIDLKTRQLDADYKNLEYADKDDPALMDTSPKDTRPSSPSTYVPSSLTNPKHDDLSAAGSSAGSSSGNNDRNNGNNNNNNANIGSMNNPPNSNNSGDRSWKRSRRARNETLSRTGNNSNSLTNVAKPSQIELITDSNSNSNHSKSNVSTSVQALTTGNSSNNRKQSGNGGGNSNSKQKRKRKSGRSNNGSNGEFKPFDKYLQTQCLMFIYSFCVYRWK